MMKICAWCGKEYTDPKKRKYCSVMCAKSAHSKKCVESNKRREAAKNEPKEKRICVICGKEFDVGRGNSICCSDKCRAENLRRHSMEYYWSHKEVKMRKCVICGTEFVAKGAMKVCGKEECRVKRDKQRQKEYWESYSTIAKQKRKEYEAELKAKQQSLFDGKVLDRAEMTVDEYNKAHGTNYSYGQYVFYVESKGVK
jgi:hypothetical protein